MASTLGTVYFKSTAGHWLLDFLEKTPQPHIPAPAAQHDRS